MVVDWKKVRFINDKVNRESELIDQRFIEQSIRYGGSNEKRPCAQVYLFEQNSLTGPKYNQTSNSLF